MHALTRAYLITIACSQGGDLLILSLEKSLPQLHTPQPHTTANHSQKSSLITKFAIHYNITYLLLYQHHSMAPDKPAPLPVASNRAELSNRISLLLSKQTSFLKTLNPSPSQSRSTRPVNHNDENDDDMFKGTRPNEGIGYVRPKDGPGAADKNKEDRILRGRLLGRGGKEMQSYGRTTKKNAQPDSESEEEVGRSALGKRKRAKSAHAPSSEQDTQPKEELATMPNANIEPESLDRPLKSNKSKKKKKGMTVSIESS